MLYAILITQKGPPYEAHLMANASYGICVFYTKYDAFRHINDNFGEKQKDVRCEVVCIHAPIVEP